MRNPPPVIEDEKINSAFLSFLESGKPLLFLSVRERRPVLEWLGRQAEKAGRELFVWSMTRGLLPYGELLEDAGGRIPKSIRPLAMLEAISVWNGAAIFVAELGSFMGDALILERLRKTCHSIMSTPKKIVFLSTKKDPPEGLESVMEVLHFPSEKAEPVSTPIPVPDEKPDCNGTVLSGEGPGGSRTFLPESLSELKLMIRARYPVIYLVTWEEKRARNLIAGIGEELGKKTYMWSVTRGLIPWMSDFHNRSSGDESSDPVKVLDEILKSLEPALYLLVDFHPFLSDAVVVRKLRDVCEVLQESEKTVILISSVLKIPCELEKDIAVVDMELPGEEEIGRLFDDIRLEVLRNVKRASLFRLDCSAGEREKIIKACKGLTGLEIERVLARALLLHRSFSLECVETILSEKEQIIRKSGVLEYCHSKKEWSEVGGLPALKEWLEKRASAFTDRARDFGLRAPRGLLLLGVQGCGKSLSARAVSSLWKLPLLRLDAGKIFSSFIGSSEENLRRAIRTAEAISPCVLWIDEIEKAFAGMGSSGISDAGTASRVFATFLTWLQEKEAPVFVIATANNVRMLPPELLRKGRLDEIFFVDLPDFDERKEIIGIHLRKRNRQPEKYDLELLARKTEGFSGSELEEVVVSALWEAFDHEPERELEMEDLLKSIEETVPVSRTMKEDIEDLRNWAKFRARAAAGVKKEKRHISEGAKLEI